MDFAFISEVTDITSCSRPTLIDSLNDQQPAYGEIDNDYSDEIGTFHVYTPGVSMFEINDANIALDNVMMVTSSNNSDGHFRFTSFGNSAIFIVDSSITNHSDIAYGSDSCDVIYNDRLNSTNLDSLGIARLLFNCNDEAYSYDADSLTMDSNKTKYVDHLSATTLWIFAKSNSTEYYPGESVQFDFKVKDRLGTVIEDEMINNTRITLESGTFTASLWIDGGICSICSEGVLFSDISLDNVGSNNYSIILSSDNDLLVLGQTELIFEVTGCPVGYGSDSNELMCSECEADTFNLESDFIGTCSECDATG